MKAENQKRAISLITTSLNLLEPEEEGKIPYMTKFMLDKNAAETYEQAFGDEWHALLELYTELIRECNSILVGGLDKLCKDGSLKPGSDFSSVSDPC